MTRLDQRRTPLVDALIKYVHDGVVPFHTPGHKQGKGIKSDFFDFIGRNTLAIDLALPELDDFQRTTGPIKEAQELAADLYGAEQSFFVINGTTGGIYAMILTICGPGDKIIIPRNVHRSIIGGIILCGGCPVFVEPVVDYAFGIAMGVTCNAVAEALAQHPDAKGVLLINPTYHGVVSNIRAIIELVHGYGIPVIVDEAHGPHLEFSDELPLSAMAAGADICSQSTHKILGAMTQASIVHARSGLISISRLKTMLQLVQTTSPNYVLLASLDAARAHMAAEGRDLVGRSIEIAQKIHVQVNQIPGLYCLGEERLSCQGMHSFDPTKVTVIVKGIGLSGSEVEYLLRHNYNIQVELSDLYSVLLIVTLGDGFTEADSLIKAFADLVKKYGKCSNLITGPVTTGLPHPPKQLILPREAMFARAVVVPFAQAAGQICTEFVTIYPPGIPLLCPGEQITQELIEYCQMLQAAGQHISGPEDTNLLTIKVVEGEPKL